MIRESAFPLAWISRVTNSYQRAGAHMAKTVAVVTVNIQAGDVLRMDADVPSWYHAAPAGHLRNGRILVGLHYHERPVPAAVIVRGQPLPDRQIHSVHLPFTG